MKRVSPYAALVLALAAICPAAVGAEPARLNPLELPFAAGVYRCDMNRTVHVHDVAPDFTSAVFKWNNRYYRLQGVATQSGAVRFEDPDSGLVWIAIRGKSMLLDSKQGKQLANDCRV